MFLFQLVRFRIGINNRHEIFGINLNILRTFMLLHVLQGLLKRRNMFKRVFFGFLNQALTSINPNHSHERFTRI